jgi:hypothetical protein
MRQQLHLRRGRGDALLQHRSSEQGIDEGAFPRVELADDDDQEQLVELADGCGEGGAILRGGAKLGEHLAQLRQELARLKKLSLIRRFEDSQHTRSDAKQAPSG